MRFTVTAKYLPFAVTWPKILMLAVMQTPPPPHPPKQNLGPLTRTTYLGLPKRYHSFIMSLPSFFETTSSSLNEHP